MLGGALFGNCDPTTSCGVNSALLQPTPYTCEPLEWMAVLNIMASETNSIQQRDQYNTPVVYQVWQRHPAARPSRSALR